MNVKIKQLSELAAVPFKTHGTDFCYDCVATSCEQIAKNVYKYGLGFALEIDKENYEYKDIILSIDIRPRSSIWKTGMVLSNSEGTVDVSYRGEVSAVFYHVMPDMPRYSIGDKICQIKLGFTEELLFTKVDELSSTERGSGGYGSTDLK